MYYHIRSPREQSLSKHRTDADITFVGSLVEAGGKAMEGVDIECADAHHAISVLIEVFVV